MPVIAHTGTGIDSGIRNLDGTVQTLHAAGRQCIHHNYNIRFRLFNDSPDNLS